MQNKHRKWLQELADEKFNNDQDTWIAINGCADYISSLEQQINQLSKIIARVQRTVEQHQSDSGIENNRSGPESNSRARRPDTQEQLTEPSPDKPRGKNK